ncbi:MAG TPA: hypothetical protein PKJ63_17235 [Cyclobacteriaceae bacterium]|nr:hypothetical protein [Cyclobacteriaceae bacterium]
MAKATPEIIEAIRKTADKIAKSADYQWGHMGACNCGFLAQEVTSLSKKEIHSFAMERHGDWNEQLNDYCPTSGLKMDDLISALLAFGFDIDDLKHLEKLSDPEVLRRLPFDKRHLKHNQKADVVVYLIALAGMLEEKLVNGVNIVQLLEPTPALA